MTRRFTRPKVHVNSHRPRETFGCGHPRWPENVSDKGLCRFCMRVRNILKLAVRDQERINSGRMTLGEKIMRGLV